MIWFTSDTHGYHKNITKGQTDWADKEVSCRDYETVEEMTDAVVNSINSYVMEDDTLYHLGDWTFGGIDKIWEFRKRIKCKNIHLILGNHDEHIKKNKPKETKWIRYYNGPIDQWYEWKDNFKTEEECLKVCNKESFFYVPHKLDYNYPQELFTSVNKYLEIEIDKKIVVLSHYAFEEWYQMDQKASYHLHGHNHHRFDWKELNTEYRRMDVGIDWKEFRPFSWDEIRLIMKNRKIRIHNS